MMHMRRRIEVRPVAVHIIRTSVLPHVIRVVIIAPPPCRGRAIMLIGLMVGFPVTGRIGRVRSLVASVARRSFIAPVRWAIALQLLSGRFGRTWVVEILAPQCLIVACDDIWRISKALIRAQFNKLFLVPLHVKCDGRFARSYFVPLLWTCYQRWVMMACFTPSPDHVFERVPIT